MCMCLKILIKIVNSSSSTNLILTRIYKNIERVNEREYLENVNSVKTQSDKCSFLTTNLSKYWQSINQWSNHLFFCSLTELNYMKIAVVKKNEFYSVCAKLRVCWSVTSIIFDSIALACLNDPRQRYVINIEYCCFSK